MPRGAERTSLQPFPAKSLALACELVHSEVPAMVVVPDTGPLAPTWVALAGTDLLVASDAALAA